jgi:ligand-binding sensor domain-containing protein
LETRLKTDTRHTRRLFIVVGLLLLALVFTAHLFQTLTRDREVPVFVPGLARLSKVYRIYDIRTDSHDPAYVWAATDAGLARYNRDNGAVRLFGRQDSMLSETVSAVLPAGPYVFAGTWWGANRLDKRSGTVREFSRNQGLTSKRVFALAAGRDGRIYIGGDEGITVADTALNVLDTLDKAGGLLSGREVYSVLPGANTLYSGHGNGTVSVIDLQKRTVSTITCARADKKTVVSDLLVDGTTLWAATSNAGVWEYDLTAKQLTEHVPTSGFPGKGAYTVGKIGREIFCGTAFGLARYHAGSRAWVLLRDDKQVRDGLFQITALAPDSGYAWYGAANLGAGKLFIDQVEWVPVSFGLTHDYIKALAAAGPDLYLGFGYLGDCADLYDKTTLEFRRNIKPWEGPLLERVGNIITHDDFVFFCGYSGLAFRPRKKGAWTVLSRKNGVPVNEVTDIFRSGNRLVLATDRGIRQYDLKNGGFMDPAPEFQDRVNETALTGDTLLLGTLRSGIQRFDLNQERLLAKPFFQGARIQHLAVYQGRIWTAFFPAGIQICAPDGTPAPLPAFPGKKDKAVRKVLDEAKITQFYVIDGRLWIGTEKKGIVIFDGQAGTWHRLTHKHGLVNNTVVTLRDDSTHVWAGLFGGINRFDKALLYGAMGFNRAEP